MKIRKCELCNENKMTNEFPIANSRICTSCTKNTKDSPLRKCRRCKINKPYPNEFKFRNTCTSCCPEQDSEKYIYSQQKKAARQALTEAERKKDISFKSIYGISIETFYELKTSQNNLCAICKSQENTRELSIDHDHDTGEIRGLLCVNCNLGLGNFQDSQSLLELAIEYLKKPKIKKEYKITIAPLKPTTEILFNCSKCKKQKKSTEFDSCKDSKKPRPVASQCKECRSESYFSKYKNSCKNCKKNKKLNINNICKNCNELNNLRQCSTCNEILHFSNFYGKKAHCIPCLKSRMLLKKTTKT